MALLGNWTFTTLNISFPSTIFPNIGFWNGSNGTWEYEIEIAWPLNWTSRSNYGLVETLYVLDGNANGHSAVEAVRRRRPVEFYQPDTIVVSLGYPSHIADSPYSTSRYADYQPPVCENCTLPAEPGVPSNADNFIAFLDNVLRPWVQKTVFPNTIFSRDALHGHSFGGLFAFYALLVRPDLFDTFLIASPALYWNDGYVFGQLGRITDDAGSKNSTNTKPALMLAYGHLEQYPVRRRIETDAEWDFRRNFLTFSNMSDNCKRLYEKLKESSVLRDVVMHEYAFGDHASVGAASISDGLDYFYDWEPRIAGS